MKTGPRSLVWRRRQLIDGIRFRIRTGAPRRDVPVEYGPWSRIHDLFRRWQRDGTRPRILTRIHPWPQKHATARGPAPAAANLRAATRPTTTSVMRSSAASIASKGTAPWRRATTSSRSATRLQSSSLIAAINEWL
ncbi:MULTISPECIES: transposase [Streptomyces]|uniref:transposase n=1 Tax=Streptomyces TaxID=1883 RepID=UPI0021A3F7B6|nr:transposase [Streptomyces atratus]MCT2546652.1 transposase [Streptomyces atratus]